MASNHAFIGVFLITGILFVLAGFLISRFIRPHNPYPEKLTTYECGEEPVGGAWIQYNVRYYLFAILFVVFDVEIFFLFPWALVFRSLGLYSFIEMMVFLALLLLALIYAWRKGDLRWV